MWWWWFVGLLEVFGEEVVADEDAVRAATALACSTGPLVIVSSPLDEVVNLPGTKSIVEVEGDHQYDGKTLTDLYCSWQTPLENGTVRGSATNWARSWRTASRSAGCSCWASGTWPGMEN